MDSDALRECPACKTKVRVLYRDRPKGERAEFVCFACVPAAMQPSREEKNVVLDIHRALNPRGKR